MQSSLTSFSVVLGPYVHEMCHYRFGHPNHEALKAALIHRNTK